MPASTCSPSPALVRQVELEDEAAQHREADRQPAPDHEHVAVTRVLDAALLHHLHEGLLEEEVGRRGGAPEAVGDVGAGVVELLAHGYAGVT